MEPAASIISKFGGPSVVSRIAGVHRTRVSNWMRAKAVGGTGGNIPFKHVPALLSAAAVSGIDLSAADFLPRTVNGHFEEAVGHDAECRAACLVPPFCVAAQGGIR